jgi:Tfp pilus assembly protein PilF
MIKWSHSRVIFLLFVVTTLTYWNTLGNGFVWDDEVLVNSNSYIRNFSYLGAAFRTDLFHGRTVSAATHYRPLQTLSYMLDYMVWGLNPFGYHLTNILLHALCVLLVYAMCQRLFGGKGLACAVALLFAVHPINTNAITYVAGRADPMAFAGMLGALLLLDISQRSYPAWRGVLGAYVGSVACYLVALFSRESALSFPVLVILYALIAYPSPQRRWWNALVLAAPYLLLGAAFCLLRHMALTGEGRMADVTWALPLALRVQIPFRSLATYFGLLFWPAQLHMERQVVLAGPWMPMLTAAGVLALSAWLALTVWARRRSPLVLFGAWWFLLLALPALGIVSLNATMAEHWIYVPSIGFYLAVLVAYRELEQRQAWLQTRAAWWTARCVFAAIIVALAARTVARNAEWANPLAFYARTKQLAWYSAIVRANLGQEYFAHGRDDLALQELLDAERLAPKDAPVKLKLAFLYQSKGDLTKARAKLKEGLQLSPRSTTALLLAADLAEQAGQFSEAQKYFITALGTTANPQPWIQYADFLLRRHRNREALAIAREALTLEPGSANLHNLLGIVLSESGDDAGAERAFRAASKLDRHSTDSWINLGRLAARHGDIPSAFANYRQALRVDPENLAARYQIAMLHWKLNDKATATMELRRLEQFAPDNADIRLALDKLRRGEDPTMKIDLLAAHPCLPE